MLSYVEMGSGEPVVFIHGLGSRKESWSRQHELSSKYRLIMLDLRGHGETELEDNITMDNFAKDVIELLEHLEIKEAFICGLSLGGIVVQEIHKQRPDIIKGLILANTTFYIDPFAGGVAIEYSKMFTKDEIIEGVVRKGLHNHGFINEAKKAFLIRDKYFECAKAPLGINYFLTLLSIEKPVLIIGGRYDRVTPAYNQVSTTVAIGINAKLVMLEAGHLSNIEQSDEFNRNIEIFIDKCDK